MAAGLLAPLPAAAQTGIPGTEPLGLAGPATPAVGAGAASADPRAPRLWTADPFFGIGRPDPGLPGQLWNLQPSVDLQVGATDNVRGTASDRRSDVFTRVSPQLLLSADTAEFIGSFAYRPALTIYAGSPEQNRFDHFLSGQGVATLVPDLLFLDVSGFADARSVFGDFGGLDALSEDRRERVQTASYQVSPYLVQRFGGFATGRIGYRYRSVSQSGRDASLPGEDRPFFNAQDFTSQEGYGVLRSGEDWGRLAWIASVGYTAFEGSGIYDGAHRFLGELQLRYGLTREWSVLGAVGYQDERYAGIRPYTVEDPIWNVGVRYAPDDENFATLRYGERDGFGSFAADAAIRVGVRTRLFLRYSEQISSSALQAAELLNSLRVDALGNVVDAATGVPAPIAFGSSLLSQQSNLFRTKRGVLALSQSWPRDTITLSLSREEREPIAVAPGTTAFEQESTTAGVAWSRELTPSTGLTVSGQVALTDTQGRGSGTGYSAQVTLAQAITPTLTGALQYRFRSRETEGIDGTAVQNTILFTLRQVF